MADRKKRGGVTPEQSAALDRVAARVREGDGGRLLAFVEKEGRSEAIETAIIDQVRAAIEGSGRTMYALAAESGISQSTLSKFLSGSRPNLTIETLAKLCDALGLVVRLEPAKRRAK
jgi:DNA-binding phage protein